MDRDTNICGERDQALFISSSDNQKLIVFDEKHIFDNAHSQSALGMNRASNDLKKIVLVLFQTRELLIRKQALLPYKLFRLGDGVDPLKF